MTVSDAGALVTLRCPFCLTLNRIELSKASARPKCGSCGRPMLLDRPVKVSEEDFERTVLGAAGPVIVDFYADWCGPCKVAAPLLDQIARERTGRMLVVKVDTDRAPELSRRYGIRGIPTFVAFRGGREVARRVGFDPEQIRTLLGEL